MTLTDAGESFYQHASLILEELRAAQEDIRQRQGQLAGQINIGMGASISRSLMPAVISRFHQQHPQVKVRIVPCWSTSGNEADDLAATLAVKVTQAGHQATIVSTDKGYCQLLSPTLRIRDYFQKRWQRNLVCQPGRERWLVL